MAFFASDVASHIKCNLGYESDSRAPMFLEAIKVWQGSQQTGAKLSLYLGGVGYLFCTRSLTARNFVPRSLISLRAGESSLIKPHECS